MSNLAPKRTGKSFFHKVYDSNNNYLTTWSNETEIMNVPSFTWSINGGMGEMSIELARSIQDFNENVDVALNNRVQTYILDNDNYSGTKIFDGVILSYEPIMNENGEQYIKVNVISHSYTLKTLLVKDGSNTTITYSTITPSEMIKDLLNKYNGIITYTATSIDDISSSYTYTFRYTTYFDALKKCLELAPAYWYWYIDANNIFYLREVDWNTIDHKLYIGKEINAVNAKKSIEGLYNSVYFLGGDDGTGSNLYRLYENISSQNKWGEKHYQMRDNRVTVVNTAEAMAEKFLDENNAPFSEIIIKVIDNSVDDTKGYDIESFKPGDVLQVLDPKKETRLSLWDVFNWDEDNWDYDVLASLGQPMQIKNIKYNFFDVELTLASKPEEISERIQNIDKNLEILESENIPNTPS